MSARRKFAIDGRPWACEISSVGYSAGCVEVAFTNGAIRRNLILTGEQLSEIVAGLRHRARVLRAEADAIDKHISGASA